MNFPRARTEDLVIQEAGGETLIYDLTTDNAHCLNPTAALIWDRCDGVRSADDIKVDIERTFGASVDSGFVPLAIEMLSEKGLLVGTDPRPGPRESRRTMLRKIGLASAVALPVIASIVAPTSVLASVSCACVNPGDCLSQTSCRSSNNCNGSGVCAP